MFLLKFLLPFHHLEDESRRGIGQDQADEQREGPRRNKQVPIEHEGHSCGQHLQTSQDEGVTPQLPGLPKIELEADHEQEEHHAEFGKLV